MYHEIIPPCTHAQKEITCSNASLHPSEQFYTHKNTSANVFIVWELKDLTSSQYSVNSFSSHTINTLAEVFLCSEQFYMHKNTSASVFIEWELKELTEYCQLLKKGSESALEVRRCTTKFSHLAHMRRRRSPVPMQVYIPVNSCICIRTLPQVYSSF